MTNFLRRLYSILWINTLFAVIVAVSSTLLSIHYWLQVDFPLTIIWIAVVFPIVFSIWWAYKRREAALVQYWIMKSMSRSLYFASRDWLRDSSEKRAQENTKNLKIIIHKLFQFSVTLFQSKNIKDIEKTEMDIYLQISQLSKEIETLRDRWMSGSEVSKVHQYLNKFTTAFEVIKHIFQYRTPRTLRLYSKMFIYITLIVLWPYFSLMAEGQFLWLGLVKPILFAMVFTALDNIQEHLENPFDQIWEDDIKINPNKIAKTLDL